VNIFIISVTESYYRLVHDTIYLAEIYRRFGGTYGLIIFIDFCAVFIKAVHTALCHMLEETLFTQVCF